MSQRVDGIQTCRLIVIVSDHGTIEEMRVGYTRNPALGIVSVCGTSCSCAG